MKVISGAQTGVDRGALDAALELGLPCGGTVPKGRLAEDGKVPERYPVIENGTAGYAVRTEKNVLDADATLILTRGGPTGGTAYTVEMAKKHRKPCKVVKLGSPDAAREASHFIREARPSVLNVAGPRESKEPGIADQTRRLLLEVLK